MLILASVLWWGYCLFPTRPIKVTEVSPGAKPPPNQPAIKILSTGHLSGSVLLSRPDAQQSGYVTPSNTNILPDQKQGPCGSNLGFQEGDMKKVPIYGELKTDYYGKSGELIGQGTHKISGVAAVSITNNNLNVDVTFPDSYQITVDIPEYKPPPVYFFLGAQIGQVVKPDLEIGIRLKKVGPVHWSAGLKWDGLGWITTGLRN